MKKLVLSAVLVALMLPLVAQTENGLDFANRVPLVSTTITKENLPQSVVNSASLRFDKNNPLTWSKFPYALKEFGWVYDLGTSESQLVNFEVTMENTNGDLLWAAYNAEGELTETRQNSKNVPVPQYIRAALAEGEFKDWKIAGTREMISFYNGPDFAKADQHFRLVVEKGKERKRLAFDYEGSTGKLEARVIR